MGPASLSQARGIIPTPSLKELNPPMTETVPSTRPHAVTLPLNEFRLWKTDENRPLLHAVSLELTARCNNDCRHCSINRPAGDPRALAEELSAAWIERLADEAARLGALWFLLTGGEPLLRTDFAEIYMSLKRKGFLVSVFTNATLLTDEHAALFRAHPPREIEVTVYGITRETYERVTRRPGSFNAFRQGLDRLLATGAKIRLKAMALRSNRTELAEIFRFCRERTAETFRFDPLLNLRHDGDPARNAEIAAERLSPEEIAELERADPERASALLRNREMLMAPAINAGNDARLFHCGAGDGHVVIGPEGRLRLCESLLHPETLYDLRTGSLAEAVESFIPAVRARRSARPDYLARCGPCAIRNLCFWCPGTAHLETGDLDASVDYFCLVAHARKALCEDGLPEPGRVSPAGDAGEGQGIPGSGPNPKEASMARGNKPLLQAVPGEILSLSERDLRIILRAAGEKGAGLRFQARGSSMHPFVRDGDVVTVSPLFGRRPFPGDIVAFVSPATRKLAVHRIVGRSAERYLIRGDNSLESDGLVGMAELLGLVKRVERSGRPVRTGLILFRRSIAALSRRGLLRPLIGLIHRIRNLWTSTE